MDGMIERFVSAVERIAAALEAMLNKAAASAGITTLTGIDPAKPGGDTVLTPDYEKMVAAGDRAGLLKLCEGRELTVPKGTKNSTLSKMLTTWDQAHAETEAGTEGGAADNVADPFSSAAGNEPDPFGDNEPDPPTRDELKAVLKQLQADPKKGDAVVIAVMETAAGVKAFQDITDDKLAAVMEEAKKHV